MRLRHIVSSLFGCLIPLSAYAQEEPPSAFDFAMKQTAGLVEMGPEGRMISFLSRSYSETCWNSNLERVSADSCDEDERRLAPVDIIRIIDLETMEERSKVPIPDDNTVNWIEWTSPDNLLISITTSWRLGSSRTRRTGSNFRNRTYQPPSGRILSISLSTGNMVVLFGDESRLLRNNRNLASTVDLLHDDPEHVLMAAYRGSDYDLFRVNVLDGSAERVAKRRDYTFGWYTDINDRPAVRLDCSTRTCSKIKAYRPADGADPNDEDTDWIHFQTYDRRRRGDKIVEEVTWIAPTGEPDEFFVEVEGMNHERRVVKVYNIRSGEFVREVFSDPDYDIQSAIRDPETGRFAGVSLWRDRIEYHLEDARLQAHLNAINAYFDNRWNVSMVGFSNDGGRAVVFASAPHDAGGYYIYDFEDRHVTGLLSAYQNLPSEFASQTEVLSIPTRDGETITAYHSKPGMGAQRRSGNPLVVLVHGGPETRDRYDYDRDVQFLLTRGFQVLQVNFRGSSGYGREFAEAGYREWGGRMQDDVMDATQYLYDRGIASPDASCIMGHSYGGYVAMFAGAKAADKFSCVIAGAGVSDLYESMRQDRREHGADSFAFEYWTKSIGDMQDDRDRMEAASPINFVEGFDDPVLLIHGEDDDVVQYSQSEEMYEALVEAGKSVEFLTLDEGHYHNRWAIESSQEYFETLQAFLDRIFPPTG